MSVEEILDALFVSGADMLLVAKLVFACGEKHSAVPGAERTRLWRERKCDDVTSHVTQRKAPTPPKETNTPLDNPSGYLPPKRKLEEDFENFWRIYPRKIGKGAARKAYGNARKRASEDEIVAGAKRYAAAKTDPEYTKHASTWLNADCWLDDHGSKVVSFLNPTGPQRTWAEIKAERESKREQKNG